MRAKLLLIVAVLFGVLPGTGWAIRNPVGRGTVPSSRGRSGLIRSPNPIDRSGNLVITGNVGRGRHFRGVVPYRATTDFGAVSPSSSLDSFLRDSAGSEDFGRFSSKSKPYYSTSRTVTTTSPGRSGVIRPPTTRVGGRAEDRFVLPPLPRRHVLASYEAAVSLKRLRPMAMTPKELERLISSEVGTYLREETLTAEQRQVQSEQFLRDLKRLSDKADELEKKLTGKNGSLKLSTTKKRGIDAPQRFETLTPKAQAGKEGPQRSFVAFGIPDKQLDVYEQMKWQLYSFQKGPEPSPVEQQAKEAAGGRKEPSEKQRRQSYQKQSSQEERLSEASMYAVRAKAIMGSHKTFASFSEDRFNQHLRAAEHYLKQGKYYRAADAYTLASIYKPNDPLAYAGKSHALFAAGEYMSSALFLSRALEIFPEYARFKIDIESMVGDRDKLETRVADVEEWLEKSGAAELQFLLGYVHYQMGRPERAKEAIGAAYEKMPQAPAVITLKEAIEIADSK